MGNLSGVKFWVVALMAVALASSSISAQKLAVEKRGMAAKSAFQVDGFDQINLFSGARTGTIALGSSYPVSPALSYGFTLFNNANGWDHNLVTCNPGGAFDLPVQNEDDNAGFAWRLHLGKVVPGTNRWRYTAPDGSERGFYDELHPGSGSEEDVYYSNDSSYLRLRYTEIGSGPCETPSQGTSECVQIDFPNGNVHEFRNFGNRQDPDFRVTRMKDAFGNKVDVTYPPDLVTWKISDDHGREHFVRFAGPGGLYERVAEVDLEAFGGARAVYSFEYTNTAIDRQGFNPDLCGSESERVTVPLLTRLVLPDGAFYDFDYYETDDLATDVLSGGMRSVRLPTRGEIRWEYERLIIPSQDPDGRYERYRTTTYAVSQREMALSAGGPAHGVWTYDYQRSLEQVPGDDAPPCHRATTVTDPVGNETVHYFTASEQHRWSYGLPFTRCAPGEGYDAAGPFLSMEVYDGTAATGTKLRSIYVEYESDGINAGGGDDNQEKNHRLTYRKTVYHDDGERFKDMRFSDFDGLGNHRVKTYGGNFSSQDPKTVTVDYNGSLGSAFTLPASSDPWILGTWTERQVSAAGTTAITEACFDGETEFLERTRTLAGASRSSVDVLSVFVEETIGGQGTGHVAQELFYGGDDIAYALDSTYGDLCSMTLPFSGQPPRYRTDHEYESGVLSRSTAMDACDGSAVVTTTDVDVDASTGLVERSRDAAGVYTAFVYDLRGRLVAERSQESAWTTYSYQLPTTTSPGLQPRLTVQDCANGSSACSATAALTWQRLDYDGLGRQVTERVRYPATSGIVEKARVTAYNALGWKLSQSVWGDTTKKTVFQDHDPFGRPGKITPPGQPSTWLTYEGDRVKTRETRVMLEGAGAPQPVFTTQIYDARGRLIEVCEDRRTAWAGNCSDGLLTSYRYDVGDRLERVCSNEINGACGQERHFVYDHRGFLAKERHPETGPIGNGWILYEHDARGNVRSKDTANTTLFDLIYYYDAAGRLIRVEEAPGGNPRVLKEFFYAMSNSGSDRRAGKLVQTRRHNWVQVVGPLRSAADLDAVITESFRYQGKDGRVSSKRTTYSLNGGSFAFDLSQTYDDLGNVATLTYPQCLHSQGGCPQAAPQRTVTNTYLKGFLRSVPGYADQISYQAGGMLHEIEHSNGVTYTMEIDPSTGLERPHRIRTSAGWNTGVYSYDGVGNISQIGSQIYRYDGLSRLIRGHVDVNGTLKEQRASYDVYGNITQLITDGSTQSTPTDASTNRLQGPLASYDAGGNVTSLHFGTESYEYTYDATNMMKYLQSNTDLSRVFLYNANDERIATFECPSEVCDTRGALETWTLRGFDNQVLRIYEHPWNEGWQWKEDYLFVNQDILTVETPEGPRHQHLDHLGTPNQMTDVGGAQTARHSYHAFGEEATSPSQNEFALKFTGHERDSLLQSRHTLDYMHARFQMSSIGRFLSVDPKKRKKARASTSLWNRYTYSANNPGKYIDPDGEEIVLASTGKSKTLKNFLVRVSRRPSGRATLKRFAADSSFKLTLADSRINSPAKLAVAQKNGRETSIVFGRTTETASVVEGERTVTGASITIDTATVQESHFSDKTGVVTTSHELYHAIGYLEGQSEEEIAAGDKPTNATGPAANFGERILDEEADLSVQDAEDFLDSIVSTSTPE